MERIGSHLKRRGFNMRIETPLRDEIRNEFEELKKMKLGSDEYRNTVDGLTKLIDRALEIEKMDADHREKVENRDYENDFKQRQMTDERRDRLVKNILTGAGIIIPSALTVWGTIKTLKFEQEGTVTTIVGRGFINKLLPKK